MRVRVHQHVNPLAPFYRQSPQPVELEKIFANPELPLHLDLGCARGRFVLRMAESDPQRNFLGVEIRESLVDEANLIAREKNLKNLHYEFCNAMIWLDKLLKNVPVGILQMVTIQFPDPWFKKKHAKRRMVNEELVRAVVDKLKPGGRIFVQTDIPFLAEEMFEIIERNAKLMRAEIEGNPFVVKTERERAVEAKTIPVYRALFEKK